ncbi:MAG: DUF255 domain-containing protein [Betaproteobacteria bacterium]|nr:DUF255 domain-containing protein [Betaproteobacteria bacterium]
MPKLQRLLPVRQTVVAVFAVLNAFALMQVATAAAAERPSSDPPRQFTHTNRLAHSNSPYLLSHAHNPVDWYPWGPEALAKAKKENKPIFLSIGYSTCYWCHVAERTIYSKPEFAKLMNAWFVNIKVDREQRPDLDRIYMLATQIMTGRGGWPNNLFLTPDLKPFFAGSYFPPHDDELGRTGFSTILKTIRQVWTTEPRRLTDVAERVHAALRDYQQQIAGGAQRTVNPDAWLTDAIAALLRRVDKEHGGLVSGGSTKFPQTPILDLLLTDYRIRGNAAALEILTGTLDAMAYGGIYDHLGGGFHRYSIEPSWSIPHFEKMLYDNAQLMRVYAEAFALTKNSLYQFIAIDVAEYLRRQMAATEGGFYTAQDAEVKGKEGASYVWTRSGIVSILGAQAADRFFEAYALTPLPASAIAEGLDQKDPGEAEGVIRIRLPIAQSLKRAKHRDAAMMLAALQPLRKKLLDARNQRVQPLRDDKIIVGLNGLVIEAFTESGRRLDKPEYVSTAARSGDYIWAVAYDAKSEVLKHEIFSGRVQTDGYLDDYALLGRGYLSLYRATGQPVWLERTRKLGDAILTRFARPDGTLLTSTSGRDLLITPLDDGDNAQPSGTSAAVELLLRLAAATGKPEYTDAAEKVVRRLSSHLEKQAIAWSAMVVAVNAHKFDPQIAALGDAAVSSAQRQAPAELRVPGTADHVKVDAILRAEGGYDEIAVTLKIDKGYHVNANPASFPYLIPTRLSFDGIAPISITYPKPILFRPEFARKGIKVYEGNPTLVAKFAKGVKQKMKAVRATVTAQACNDKVCLPPSELPITINTLDKQ